MSKKLVIVESPTKARTITRILSGDYEITASGGHIRDLPEKSLGIDIENNFEPQYVDSDNKKSIIKQLKASAKKADEIYLAPDPDREGEAIAWHLHEILSKNTKATFHRVTFHEITKNAVSKAFEEPGEINVDLVNAQQARRLLDRLVGYQVSPLLWSKLKKGLSAGRVQSVALRIVCDREKEILAFNPVEYWVFEIDFEAEKKPGKENVFTGKLIKINGKKAEVGNGDLAATILNDLKMPNAGFAVSNIDVKMQTRKAPPPFITSTMQQAAGSSATQTMRVAQQLYEGLDIGSGGHTGLITYMRTDSVAVAKEAQGICREFIGNAYGQEYVPAKPNYFKSKSSAQGAHEAIRPTDVSFTPEKASKYLDPAQLRLYTLIWKRFVASQMAPAKYQKTVVDIDCHNGKYTLRSEDTIIVFPGFTKLRVTKDGEDGKAGLQILGELNKGDKCFAKDIRNEQKFTEPPPRYTEPSLIRELEANGIGRPSTYAPIVRTILNREYCEKQEKSKIHPTELGMKLCDYLLEKLPALFEISFTSEMEKKLDQVEEGKLEWRKMLTDFYDSMSGWLTQAKYAGAPEQSHAKAVISILDNIKEWAPAEKRGRRTYDDHKFSQSIKEQFEKNSELTEKQWTALLTIAYKYKDQIPDFEKFVTEHELTKEIAEIKEIANANKAALEARAEHLNSDAYRFLMEAFEMLSTVEWEEPVKRGRRVYDDSKFVESLKKQAESGRILSDKQIAALKKIALKYIDKVSDAQKLKTLLSIDESEQKQTNAENAEKNEELEKAFEALSKVTEWAEPEKKGKRVYDDKAFYESLKSQYDGGRKLSGRQEFALKKLISKYEK
jgi:DNA topoisomerase-1